MKFPIRPPEERIRQGIEEGTYHFKVKEWKYSNSSKDGKEMLVLVLQLLELDITVKVWLTFSDSKFNAWLLSTFCASIGKPELYESGQITGDDVQDMYGTAIFKFKKSISEPDKSYLAVDEYIVDNEFLAKFINANEATFDDQIPF